MMKRNISRPIHHRHGSLLIDAILAVALFGAIIAGFSKGIKQGQLGTINGSDRIRALYLAEEGLKGVQWIRDQEDDDATGCLQGTGETNVGFEEIYECEIFATASETYGVQMIEADWQIVDDPTEIDGYFTRTIRFSEDTVPDSNERIVESIVSWNGIIDGYASSVEKPWNHVVLTSKITNWQVDPPPPPPDWGNPVFKASIIFNDNLERIAIKGNTAFIVGSLITRPGFYKVDISNPSSPTITDTANTNSSTAPSAMSKNIALYGDYAYVINTDTDGDKIKILDINQADITCNITNPCAGTIFFSSGMPTGIVAKNNKLFITKSYDPSGPEFLIYDLSIDPTNPTLLGELDESIISGAGTPNYGFYDISVEDAPGTDVYISGNSLGDILRIDISDPTSPTYQEGGDMSGKVPAYAIDLIDGESVFLGKQGDSSFNSLFGSKISSDPNPIPESSSVDLVALNSAYETVHDITHDEAYKIGFLATYLKRSTTDPSNTCTPKLTKHYFITMDFSDPINLDLPSSMLYKGACALTDPANDCLLQANELCVECTYDPILDCNEVGKGIAYDENTQTAYLVTGGGGQGHLLIFKPSYSY